MNKQKKYAWLATFMAASMALSGCGSVTVDPVSSSSEPEESEISIEESMEESSEEESQALYPASLPEEIAQIQLGYQINLDDQYYLDANGKQIPADKIERSFLKDQLTGENRYAVCKMAADNGDMYTRVYSMKNELLIDWTTDTVQAGVGTLVIRSDKNSNAEQRMTALVNPVNGDVVVEGAAILEALTEDRVLVTDASNRILGVIDASGAIKAGFPMAEDVRHSTSTKGYFFGDLLDETAVDGVVRILYDAEGNEILRDAEGRNPIIGFYSIVGDYVIMNETESEGRVVKDLHTLEDVVHVAKDTDLNYFDGERMLVRVREDEGFYLLDGAQDVLNGWFTNYFVASVDAMGIKSKAENFYVLDEGWLTKQDVDGNYVTDYHTDGLKEAYAESGWISIVVENGEELSWGLLNKDLEVVANPGLYNYFNLVWSDDEHAIWEARYMVDDQMKIALLNEAGDVLLENVDAVGTASESGVAIIVDGNIGVLHMDGGIDLAALK